MKSDELAASPPSHLGSLGGLLRWHRLRLGLSQESLAEALGVSTRSIRRWEQDLALPQELSRQRLGHLLGMDLEHILALGAIGQHEPAARSLPAYSVDRLAATFEQGFLLLESKLRPPRLPSPLIERERLLTRLEAAREHQLTVLCAPAGWGKTTLLSTWAARCQEPVAWVSLEALDADPTRFWVLAMTALRQCGSYPPSLGDVALAMLRSCEPPALTTVLTALIQQIESTAPEAQTILILDDYQMIEDPTTHESVLFLLEHLPASLHLVLSSRVEPALPLSRLRLRSQVLELRDAQLRLTEDEARSFLTAVMGYQLTQEDVHLLQERTEGWIAGLQLAALALRDRLDRSSFIKMFGGHHRVLLDYVQQEILERQTQPIQSFLLQTSVLTQMNAALCQAVTGQQASQHLLEELERAHLFVVALDEQRHWYRLHGLFREALLARLSV